MVLGPALWSCGGGSGAGMGMVNGTGMVNSMSMIGNGMSMTGRRGVRRSG